MKTLKEMIDIAETREYGKRFRDVMRFKQNAEDELKDASFGSTGGYLLPGESEKSFRRATEAAGVIRPLASQFKSYDGDSVIWAFDSDDHAALVPEGGAIPGFDTQEDFTQFRIGAHKIAGLVKVGENFVYDAGFDVGKYIEKRMAKSFAKTEDNAFVNGTGTGEPFGLLHDTEGAEIGVTTPRLSYDACVDLFFSVEPEYRKNAVWLVNDRTALALRKLRDSDGNFLWHPESETILGKRVVICNDMPDVGSGSKPILFGDLCYYWIVDRSPVSVRILRERFALSHQIGYVAFELLDGRLIRKDAVKALFIGQAVSGSAEGMTEVDDEF